MTIAQRRRWERYRKEFDVAVELHGGRATVQCKSVDVCEGGIGILCPEQLATGADYRFSAPALTASPFTGTVRWCTPMPARGQNHVGVELSGLTARQVDDVRRAIETWKAEDAGADG
jgi:hypothetical protein